MEVGNWGGGEKGKRNVREEEGMGHQGDEKGRKGGRATGVGRGGKWEGTSAKNVRVYLGGVTTYLRILLSSSPFLPSSAQFFLHFFSAPPFFLSSFPSVILSSSVFTYFY